MVCGATGTSSGSSFLPNRFSTPEPFAEPFVEPLAADLAAGVADAASLLAGLVSVAVALVPVLAGALDAPEVPLLAAALLPAVVVLAVVVLLAAALLAAELFAAVLLVAAPELPDAACTADAPTVALPTTGRLRNRKYCCPSVQMLVVTQ